MHVRGKGGVLSQPAKKEKGIYYFRMWALPALLIAVFILQLNFPNIHKHGALWSDDMHWWQFLTCNFLSRDMAHLTFNAGGLVIVYSQFAPRVKGPVLALTFCLFATLSNLIFFMWFMPDNAWLIGTSGGSYALLGFFAWFLRRAYFSLGIRRLRWLKFRIIPVLVVSIIGEYFYARWRMPTLAWQMHAIGFGLGVSSAMLVYAIYALSGKFAGHWPAQRLAPRLGATVYLGIYRVKQFSEISGKPGAAEEVV